MLCSSKNLERECCKESSLGFVACLVQLLSFSSVSLGVDAVLKVISSVLYCIQSYKIVSTSRSSRRPSSGNSSTPKSSASTYGLILSSGTSLRDRKSVV